MPSKCMFWPSPVLDTVKQLCRYFLKNSRIVFTNACIRPDSIQKQKPYLSQKTNIYISRSFSWFVLDNHFIKIRYFQTVCSFYMYCRLAPMEDFESCLWFWVLLHLYYPRMIRTNSWIKCIKVNADSSDLNQIYDISA